MEYKNTLNFRNWLMETLKEEQSQMVHDYWAVFNKYLDEVDYSCCIGNQSFELPARETKSGNPEVYNFTVYDIEDENNCYKMIIEF